MIHASMEAITLSQNFNFKPSPQWKPQKNFAPNCTLRRVAKTSISDTLESSTLDSLPNLSAFTILSSLKSVRANHAQIIKMPDKWDSNRKVQSLIESYLEFDDFHSAATVFFMGFVHNRVYWTSFLEEFRNFGGDPYEILEVFVQLHNKGLSLSSKSFTFILKLCGNLMDIWLGLEVHACLIKRGLESDINLKSALMKFYGICWDGESANKFLNETLDQKLLLWNEAVLVELSNQRWLQGLQTFQDMLCSSVKANSFTIAKLLQACAKEGALDRGKQIHGYVIRNAMESNLLICNSIINMYCKNGDLRPARAVFDSMENRDLTSWNSIISGYMAQGSPSNALELFYKMESSNLEPDIVTWNCLLSGHFHCGLFHDVLTILRKMQISGYRPDSSSLTSVLQVVSELCYQYLGREIHSYVIRNGLEQDLHVVTSLIDMYVKNDNLISAQAVLDRMKYRNVFAWNALISGYAFKGNLEKAASLLNQMENEGTAPDLVTYNSMVYGYAMLGHIKEALSMVRLIKRSGLTPNVITWTALISGCSQAGYQKHALEFCVQMQCEGTKPNSTTIASLLRTCAGLSLLQKGKEIHGLSIRNGFTDDLFVTTALIDMYGKCGCLKNAIVVFQRFGNRALATWNSMMMAFANYGYTQETVSLFRKMLEDRIQPDAITFTALLSSCKHSGSIDQAWKYFDSLRTVYGIIPTMEHYSCMVDLLGKAGYLDEAWDFIKTVPTEIDATIWGALLGSCRIHNNVELGETAAKKLFKLEPKNPANYILIMNIYAASNRWDDVDRIKDLMDSRDMKTRNIWSWIQINQTVHVFSAVGKPHPDEGEIYFELHKLISQMKNTGYAPDTKCVYQNIDEFEKEKALLSHTEKLAMTYGLIKLKNKAPIRVVKNTRMCSDCHTVAKNISLMRRRQIIVKDGIHLHHFRDGKCSCNDFW